MSPALWRSVLAGVVVTLLIGALGDVFDLPGWWPFVGAAAGVAGMLAWAYFREEERRRRPPPRPPRVHDEACTCFGCVTEP